MTLMITAASSGPAAAVEQAGPDGSADRNGSANRNGSADAFAGVLAGIGRDVPAGRPSARGSSDSRPADPADGTADQDPGTAAAELAALALAVSGNPVPPAVPVGSSSGTGAVATGDPNSPAAATGPDAPHGPAPQAALAAQQAAAGRPAQALEAQAAAAAAKASRLASSAAPTVPAEPADQPLPTTGPVPAGTGPVGVAGLPDPASAATGSATHPVPARPGLPGESASAADQLGSPAAATPAPPGPATPPGTTPAVVTMPGAAAAIASTSGAARGTGTTQPATPATPGNGARVSAPGETHRATPSGPRASHRPDQQDSAAAAQSAAPAPAPAATEPTATAPAAQPNPTGIPAVQQPVAGRPAAGHDAPQVPRHPATDVPLASQVAGPVLALRARGDGSHQMIVALHPAELGPVNLHVRISGDALTISLASSNDIAHDTLRDALPQLRSELQSAGLGAASLSLDLTSGGSAGSGGFAEQHQAGTPDRAVPVPDPISVPVPRRAARIASSSGSAALDRWL